MKGLQQTGMVAVWILTIGMSLLAICYTMIIPFLPVYLLELGVEQEQLALWSGLSFSISFFIAAIMAPVWGRLADQHGKKLMAIRAGILIGLSYLWGAFVQDEYQFLLVRAFQGFANGFMPAAMTMVSLSVPKERVGTAMGIFQMGLVLGNTVGPLTGGLTELAVGMRPVFMVAGITLFIVTAAIAIFVKEPQVESEASVKTTSFSEDLQAAKQNKVLLHILGLYFLVQAVMLMLQPIVAIYVGELKGSMEGAAMLAGSILSGGGVMGMIMTNVWAAYGQRRGYFRVISYGLMGTGTVLLLQSLPFGLWWFGALQLLIGVFIVGIFPSLGSAMTVNTDPSVRGRVFGLATTSQQLGNMIGPLFASIVATYWGTSYVFLVAGIGMMIIGYLVLKIHGNRPNIQYI
ncbi:MFS transporter [Veillonella sp. oral taxon 780]|uniref:MFS transporter n=1 Tax=Veillonella sp. oral taxon 780 TaxID=671229 RepID=UPI00021A37D1|nr:MFS transporter [Veillonella sp. oral taxon 780]EGS38423.1 transporter, major facilitator family protein [Veillonella sp. oral taxon 780 str. F0422]